MEIKFNIENLERLLTDSLLSHMTDIQNNMFMIASSEHSLNTVKEYEKGLGYIGAYKALDGGLVSEFVLSGFLPVAFEEGKEAFDMKPGLLKSPKAKISKAGNKYIRVKTANGFMTVSSKSKSSSFQHPGIKIENYFERACDKIK